MKVTEPLKSMKITKLSKSGGIWITAKEIFSHYAMPLHKKDVMETKCFGKRIYTSRIMRYFRYLFYSRPSRMDEFCENTGQRH